MENKVDLSIKKENISTAQAVVIGCSHNDSKCDHKMHPSKEDFFTIDILQALKPDHTMDITKEQVPTYLKNKFKLTILEYLPYDVYNYSKESKKYWNIDGEMGLNNIRELTSDDGFIMVVGNSRDFRFRNSIASLNYLEIAHSEDFKRFVLLIPKNQNLSASEVMEQIQKMPKALQGSIQTATTQGFTPVKSIEYCKLNYTTSEKNKNLIDHLNLYWQARAFEKEYKEHYNIFDFEFKFGYSRNEKLEAADALIAVLLGNSPESSLEAHLGALNNGELGKIVNHYLNGRPICALIDKTESKEHFNGFKKRYTDIKQQDSYQEKMDLPSISNEFKR
jgi:hypothetical protein